MPRKASSTNPLALLKREAYNTNEEYRKYVLSYQNNYTKKRYETDEEFKNKQKEAAREHYHRTKTEEKLMRQRVMSYLNALNTGRVKNINPELKERYNIDYNEETKRYYVKETNNEVA